MTVNLPAAPMEPSTSPAPSRVARIPYLNVAPFHIGWSEILEQSEGIWIPCAMPPRQLGRALAAGEVDAGLLATADLHRFSETVEPLLAPSPNGPVALGVACRADVQSVLLFMRAHASHGGESDADVRTRPRTTLNGRAIDGLRGARVALTTESSTSVRLLRILLEELHRIPGLRYERVEPGASLDGYDGALAIGDQALTWRQTPPPDFTLEMDLASEWSSWTGLPFVFARWGVRRGLSRQRADWLGRFLLRSLGLARTDLASLCRNLPAALGSPADLEAYLGNFTYVLGDEELRGEAHFRELLDRCALKGPIG